MIVNINGDILPKQSDIEDFKFYCLLSDKSIPYNSSFGIERVIKGTDITTYNDRVRTIFSNALSRLKGDYELVSFNPNTSVVKIRNLSQTEDLEVQYEN